MRFFVEFGPRLLEGVPPHRRALSRSSAYSKKLRVFSLLTIVWFAVHWVCPLRSQSSSQATPASQPPTDQAVGTSYSEPTQPKPSEAAQELL
jgi:hypothetical protein